MNERTYDMEIAGKKMTAVFSDLAMQSDGAVLMKCEDTVVLATICTTPSSEHLDFFNLTVEYQERFYAAGLILGGQYNKREGRPSDKAILAGRVIDRTIRPLFDKSIKDKVQVTATVLSVGRIDPTVLAVNAASLAISASSVPWNGPVGAVHVSSPRGGAELVVNNYISNIGEPVYELDLLLSGKEGAVVMLESAAYQKSEDEIGQALDLGMAEIEKIISWQKKVIEKEGKEKKIYEKKELPAEIVALYEKELKDELEKNLFGKDSKSRIHSIEEKWKKILDANVAEDTKDREVIIGLAKDYLDNAINDLVHAGALEKNMRVDLRAMDEVRPLFVKAGGLSGVVHGSGIFYRGETHVLSVATLGGPEDMNTIEGMEIRGKKRFMHHYNFPPYSVGETGRFGGINRREMGHGFLAEKALQSVIPEKEKFPYTIRVVSETMSSNGSSSQGSICGATVALMDAGVPILAPVAGIAMGALLSPDSKLKAPSYKLLTDIQGPEDHHGDMDFKVAGTRDGVTALQLDIKVDGMPLEILKEALIAAKKARVQILDAIEKEIPTPRPDISPNAPKILIMKVKVDQIGLVIGGGGKTVNGIKDKTGAEITIEDDGTVYIVGKNGAAEAAKKIIEELVHEYKVGEIVTGTVVKIMDFGAFVKITDQAEGLIHISEIAKERINKVEDYLKEGQSVTAQVVKTDNGKIGLSLKALIK